MADFQPLRQQAEARWRVFAHARTLKMSTDTTNNIASKQRGWEKPKNRKASFSALLELCDSVQWPQFVLTSHPNFITLLYNWIALGLLFISILALEGGDVLKLGGRLERLINMKRLGLGRHVGSSELSADCSDQEFEPFFLSFK